LVERKERRRLWWSVIIQKGCAEVKVNRKVEREYKERGRLWWTGRRGRVVLELKYTGRSWWSESKEEGCGGVKVIEEGCVWSRSIH
jgi:hypothetical protein